VGVHVASLFQGLYYTATGIWPLLHMRSFVAITGPKADIWLVQTAAGLIASLGAALLLAGSRPQPALRSAAAGSALTLAAVDLAYALPGRISRVYLGDSAVQLALLALWLISARFKRKRG
jgi:hypothetical protein